jgi:putative DNA primase/helicase
LESTEAHQEPSAQPALYNSEHLPVAIERARVVILAMDKPDADVAKEWGYTSTYIEHVSYDGWRDEYTDVLRGGLCGAHVVCIPKGKDSISFVDHVCNGLKGYVEGFQLGAVPIEFGEGAGLSGCLSKGGTRADLESIVEKAYIAYERESPGSPIENGVQQRDDSIIKPWSNPEPLPDLLQAVNPFDFDLLPGVLRGRVYDIAERMQCPPDFVAIGIMTAISAVVGPQVGIKPKQRDDWLVVANLFGLCIGRPGVFKSPAIEEALKDIRRLELAAKAAYEEKLQGYDADILIRKVNAKNVEKDIAVALKAGDSDKAKRLAIDGLGMPEAVTRERFMTNDTTVEKLGELLAESHRCILVYRDELSGFLRSMDREDRSADRGFYLEAWSGASPLYTYDRVGRGTIDIPDPCVSILGSIQPGPLQEYISGAVRGSKGDDGLLQRFQLAVWPDVAPEWKNVDRWPDKEARVSVSALFDRLAHLDVASLGAKRGEYDRIHFLRFDESAQAWFDEWRESLEMRVRSGDSAPAFEAHLSKYRSLVPSIALLCHLIAGDKPGVVGEEPLMTALAWAEYLESHARRVYAYASQSDLAAARELCKHITKGDLPPVFSPRDVYSRHWTMLDKDGTGAAISYLSDFGWLREVEAEQKTGRPSPKWEAHPNLVEKNEKAAR